MHATVEMPFQAVTADDIINIPLPGKDQDKRKEYVEFNETCSVEISGFDAGHNRQYQSGTTHINQLTYTPSGGPT